MTPKYYETTPRLDPVLPHSPSVAMATKTHHFLGSKSLEKDRVNYQRGLSRYRSIITLPLRIMCLESPERRSIL